MTPFETRTLPADCDVLAPDGSEIRLLHSLGEASVVHCRLPVGAVSIPVQHRTVEEVWVILAGAGEVWRRQANREETVAVAPGMSLTIPLGTQFQFRALGDAPLEFLITTSPPWPGEDEAVLLEVGGWKA
ncbi:MAG: cupin domain-containing protein [Chloroflexi bacterium]|nr:cupin domain-containing protein [Chloroflexota bacterium]